MLFRLLTTAALACGLLAGCGGGGGGGDGGGSVAGGSGQAPADASAQADLPLLFMGNSHTANHNVAGTVAALVGAVRPGKTVLAVLAPGSQFLDEHANDSTTLGLLRLRRWSAVVMQAQKYSSSGQFDYPTAPAENLALEVRQRGAVPVLFPEWARRGVAETQRIFDLHQRIARSQPACVAPVGQAWDASAVQSPALILHDDDGNHANPSGALLAALVLASTLTGVSPQDFPNLPGLNVDDGTQARLRDAAAAAVIATPPRALCPGDRLL